MSGPPSVMLVTGSDRFHVVERFAAEKDGLAGLVDDANGIDEFEGADIEVVARALDAARTPAMFGGRRLVVLRDAVSEETLPLLQGYADAPADDASLLIVHVQSGRQSKAFTALKKSVEATGTVVEAAAAPDRPRDLGAYVSDLAREHDVKLTDAAAHALGTHVGANAGVIVGILDQLAVAYGDARVDVDDLRDYVSGPATARSWDLTDAIEAGDRTLALRRLHSLLDRERLHPLQIQAALITRVRQLQHAMDFEPKSPGDLETALGVKAYPARKIYEQLRRLDRRAVVAAHREVARADSALRGGTGLSDRTVLEILVARLAGQLGGRRSRARSG